jgi:hypothetical protein
MGLISKLKDALFEEEYVEVEEKPKKEKKVKPKKVDEKLEKSSKPIAKKVVLPGKREERIEEIEEEELRDEDFEIRPKDDIIKEEVMEALDDDQEPVLKPQTPEFLMMDDDDFKVEEEVYVPHDDGLVRASKEEEKEEVREPYLDHYKEDIYSYYQSARPKERESMPYGIRNDDIRVHEYGGYEKKEEKTGFRPSPIISPIYGILDKNYKKEDVVQKREVRLTSSYARGNVSIEDVRKKAYGSLSDDIEREIDEKEEIKEKPEIVEEIEEPENILVDLSEEQDKPFVKDVTMGDALEYYSDLGLEYNVDYMDASKERSTSKKVKEEPEVEEEHEELKEEPIEEKKEEVEEPKEEVPEIEEKKEENEVLDADDNLFDLIDSMYQEE